MTVDEIKNLLISHMVDPSMMDSINIHNGWIPILERMHNSLIIVNPNYLISLFTQVNNFYKIEINNVIDDEPFIINQAYGEMWDTCEKCGDYGQLRRFGDLQNPAFDVVLCEACKLALISVEQV